MRRTVGLFLFCGLVLPLVIVANASAQGAILELSPQSAAPGSVVNVTGAGYSPATTRVNGVDIRLSTRDAEPLRTGVLPDTNNRITTEFVVPPGLAPGEYLVIATQLSVRNRQVFGGPGRAKLRVTGARAAAASAPPGRAAPHATVLLGSAMLALLLLTGGALAARRLRAPQRPLGSYPTHSTSPSR